MGKQMDKDKCELCGEVPPAKSTGLTGIGTIMIHSRLEECVMALKDRVAALQSVIRMDHDTILDLISEVRELREELQKKKVKII